MTTKAGFKQTELGDLPEAWGAEQLSRLVRSDAPICYGILMPGEHCDFGVPVIKVKDISGGMIDHSNLQLTHPSIDKAYKRSRLCHGDILISIRGSTGRVAIVTEELHGANITQDTARVRINAQDSRDFVYHALSSESVQQQVALRTIGQAVKGINIRDVKNLLVPLPPLPEQRAIATALSDADALITALAQLIAKKRDLKQAAMQQLITGKRRLPGFSGEWEVKSLYNLAQGKKELFDDGDWIESEHITSEGIRLIQTGNIGIGRFVEKDDRKYIYESSFTSLRCKELRHGDLLICRLADPAGRACILPDIGEERIVTSVDVTIFRPPPETADRRFLSYCFSTADWFKTVSDRSGGTTHKRIARGALGRLVINLPLLPEQTAIAEILSAMDAEISALEQRRDKTRAIKQGMMQQLLTGKLRLPVGAT